MQLILITAPSTVAGEIKSVNRLFDAGLPVLHLRKPDADKAAMHAYLQQIQPQYRQRVVLHQHHELALEYGLKGIHFKERDRPPPPIPRIAPQLSQSTSLHSIQDVLLDWKNLDYAFLSPIFDSISKQGYMAAAFNAFDVADALQRAAMPVYALGGISVDKIPEIKRMGFAGIGVLGAIWAREDPVLALQEFQEALST